MSERKIPDVGTVIHALRCTSSVPAERLHCDGCHYFVHDPEEVIAAFCAEYGIKLPLDFADGCDCQQICMDAADLLEQLTGTVGGADNGL